MRYAYIYEWEKVKPTGGCAKLMETERSARNVVNLTDS